MSHNNLRTGSSESVHSVSNDPVSSVEGYPESDTILNSEGDTAIIFDDGASRTATPSLEEPHTMARIESVQGILEDITIAIKKERTEKERIISKLRQKDNQLRQKDAELLQATESKVEAIARLESENQVLVKRFEAADRRLDRDSALLETLLREFAELRLEYNLYKESHADYEEIKASSKALQSEADDHKKANVQLSLEVETTKTELSASNSKVDVLTKEVAELNALLEKLTPQPAVTSPQSPVIPATPQQTRSPSPKVKNLQKQPGRTGRPTPKGWDNFHTTIAKDDEQQKAHKKAESKCLGLDKYRPPITMTFKDQNGHTSTTVLAEISGRPSSETPRVRLPKTAEDTTKAAIQPGTEYQAAPPPVTQTRPEFNEFLFQPVVKLPLGKPSVRLPLPTTQQQADTKKHDLEVQLAKANENSLALAEKIEIVESSLDFETKEKKIAEAKLADITQQHQQLKAQYLSVAEENLKLLTEVSICVLDDKNSYLLLTE
jgi:hypothetical protein